MSDCDCYDKDIWIIFVGSHQMLYVGKLPCKNDQLVSFRTKLGQVYVLIRYMQCSSRLLVELWFPTWDNHVELHVIVCRTCKYFYGLSSI